MNPSDSLKKGFAGLIHFEHMQRVISDILLAVPLGRGSYATILTSTCYKATTRSMFAQHENATTHEKLL